MMCVWCVCLKERMSVCVCVCVCGVCLKERMSVWSLAGFPATTYSPVAAAAVAAAAARGSGRGARGRGGYMAYPQSAGPGNTL